jgi:hypothetical protein
VKTATLTVLFVLAGCGGEFPSQGGDDIATTRSAVLGQCGVGNSAFYISTRDKNTGQGNGYCFGANVDTSPSEFMPSTEEITGVVSGVVPGHLWLCDHTRGGSNGGTPKPFPAWNLGFVSQTVGHCYRTDGVNNTFYRTIGSGTIIASVAAGQSWLAGNPTACPAPSVNDTYTDCGSLSDSGLPNIIVRRFGSVIAGTWPDGTSGAPCNGLRLTAPDSGIPSTYAGNACPVN